MNKIRVWLIGAGGQLGHTFLRHHTQAPNIEWLPTTRKEVELTSYNEIKRFYSFYQPDVILNTAAYTNVDGAERNKSEALAINAELPRLLGEICQEHARTLIHYSTDFVFDGKGSLSSSAPTPYTEEDVPNPINFYGESKLRGELNIAHTTKNAYIWRTAWLYSPYGKNFYTIVRQKALEGIPLTVVKDQIGSPTSSIDLAHATMTCINRLNSAEQIPYGLYHYANSGIVSRYDFARKILSLDPKTQDLEITPCLSNKYPQIAERPKYSALDSRKLAQYLFPKPIEWMEALDRIYKFDTSSPKPSSSL